MTTDIEMEKNKEESVCHEGGCCCHCHDHKAEEKSWKPFLAPLISFVMLASGMMLSHLDVMWFTDSRVLELIWYILAFLPVGWPVLREAGEGLMKRDYFNEFTLMGIACIGAFCIGEYPEGVGVMLFYTLGETLQHKAVSRARKNISGLLDLRSEKTWLVAGETTVATDPRKVEVGQTIEIRPGERVPLDGILLSEAGVFDTAALTGESVPSTIEKGGKVLAGMISSGSTVRITVTQPYSRSTLSRILEMVEEASEKKASSELFIRRFARWYTPAVMILAVLVVAVPCIVSLINSGFDYHFSQWLYRALVFLVISCPCALVVSVPLSYFAGIGAASRAGILFKGGNYLDAMAKVNTVAFDKTGTMTTGQFTVEKLETAGMADAELIGLMASAESHSSHPLAKAIISHAEKMGIQPEAPEDVKEIAGFGTVVSYDGKRITVGNLKLLEKEGIEYPESLKEGTGTIVAFGIDGRFAGYALLADTLKEDSKEAIEKLGRLGVDDTVMLSGDRKEIVEAMSKRLGIKAAYGELLPQDKMQIVERMGKEQRKTVAFVGDGMNDAPVLAISDVGIAMGGLGSDAAVESADVVIQTDSPSRVATAIRIGRFTHTIVKENVVGAIVLKAAILALGAMGIATLWAAVFADVGVALIAVVNSMRIMWKKY